MPTRIPQEESIDENLSAEDLLKKLNLPSQPKNSSTKPKIIEVTKKPIPTSKNALDKPQSMKKGETIIKETVIKSIDEYNEEEERKKMDKSSKEEPLVEIKFNISHKKGNLKLTVNLPKEESAANIDIQLNETSFILESQNYYSKHSFQKFHPQGKIV